MLLEDSQWEYFKSENMDIILKFSFGDFILNSNQLSTLREVVKFRNEFSGDFMPYYLDAYFCKNEKDLNKFHNFFNTRENFKELVEQDYYLSPENIEEKAIKIREDREGFDQSKSMVNIPKDIAILPTPSSSMITISSLSSSISPSSSTSNLSNIREYFKSLILTKVKEDIITKKSVAEVALDLKIFESSTPFTTNTTN
jgi:hypothetical protein